MPIDKGVDTGVSTISSNIQEELSKRNYPPSYMARLINRAIEDVRYENASRFQSLKKGHFIKDNELIHVFSDTEITVNSNERIVRYKSMTMPSFEGKSVIDELDNLVMRYHPESLNKDGFYNLLAMIMVAVGSAHAFPDGTGRTAVALADVYIRKYLGKRIDLNALESLDERLTSAMTVGSLLMLPDEYNPNMILEAMSSGDEVQINIPSRKTHSTSDIQQYAKKYSENILSNLRRFNPNSLKNIKNSELSLIDDSLKPIANLLKEVTV